MTRLDPPSWLQRVLHFLLGSRDRETVSGDLCEKFCEAKVEQLGSLRASLWYLRQVVSFVPRKVGSALVRRQALSGICVFTAISAGWLALMGLRLRRPGYGAGELISGAIVGQAILTLSALRFPRRKILRPLSMLGCIALCWLSAKALIAAVRGADLEGYVLLIALLLILQAVLTWSTLSSFPVRYLGRGPSSPGAG